MGKQENINTGIRNKGHKQKTSDKLAYLSPNLSIITLYVNGLNKLIKRLAEWTTTTTKNMIHLYTVYKRLTLNTTTYEYIGWK